MRRSPTTYRLTIFIISNTESKECRKKWDEENQNQKQMFGRRSTLDLTRKSKVNQQASHTQQFSKSFQNVLLSMSVAWCFLQAMLWI